MKMNGGVAKADLGGENVEAVVKGCPNLGRHIENLKQLRRAGGRGDQPFRDRHRCRSASDQRLSSPSQGSEAIRVASTGPNWVSEGHGTDLAKKVVEIVESGDMAQYRTSLSRRNAAVRKDRDHCETYLPRGRSPCRQAKIRKQLKALGRTGLWATSRFAWPRHSIPSQPILTCRGAPDRSFSLPVREVRLSAGAGFIVVICGEIMTMPACRAHRQPKTSSSTRQARSRGCFSGRNRHLPGA